MPSQRTLIVMVAALLVTLSYLVGYISGSKPVSQGSVQAVHDSGRVKGSAQTRQDDPVQEQAGSSYNSVYTDDRGEVFHPGQARKARTPHISGSRSTGASEKAKFVFMPRAEKRTPYSWRRKQAESGIVYRDPSLTAVMPVEQGDGLYVRSRPPRAILVRPDVYGQAPPSGTYRLQVPAVPRPYNRYGPARGYYTPYGR